ncbi:hypothetical protein BJ878DRAFT_156579 [Calycina marina]|uniref:Malate dehydrogenase n=1 Tax=Calycina marina TaxID=1763456 RepID=A0A9P7Z976_9HELO|nr:hypothetical protein BJ878DRAFT_156579 [Calycina marina]
MLSEVYILSALCATALSAPTLSYSASGTAVAPDMSFLTDYFQLLASKVQEGRDMSSAPVCNLNNAELPASSLPTPAAGLTLHHVAIGRGTQNYSCDADATAAPTALGALATLYNASCIASTYPDLLAILPNLALQFNIQNTTASLPASNLMISGHHFFSNLTTPVFDLNTAAMSLGEGSFSKNTSAVAPADAVVGQNGEGYGAVTWLQLLTRDSTGNLQQVYRTNTAGGAAPPTCAGIINTSFEVQYSAAYWVFSKK